MLITSRALSSASSRPEARRCSSWGFDTLLSVHAREPRGLSAAVGRLFAVAEAYPDLKASQNFQQLQRNLVDVENNVQYARRYYNAVVRDWNTLVGSVPSGWIASAANYGERPFFQLDDDAERAAPRVNSPLLPSSAGRRQVSALQEARGKSGGPG